MPYWKTCLIAAIILYVSLLREPHFTFPTIGYCDKWSHLIAYTLLGFAAWRDSNQYGFLRWIRLFIAIVLPIVYGGSIELIQQLWFSPRTGNWMDWLADSLGVTTGCTLAHFAPRILTQNKKQ